MRIGLVDQVIPLNDTILSQRVTLVPEGSSWTLKVTLAKAGVAWCEKA